MSGTSSPRPNIGPEDSSELSALELEVISTQAGPAAGESLEVVPFDGTVTVLFSDAVIASTRRALILQESGREPIFFIPFKDIYFELLSPSPSSVACPRKGVASFWDVRAVGEAESNVMWTLEQPSEPVSALFAHGAFIPGKVRIEVTPAESPREVPPVP